MGSDWLVEAGLSGNPEALLRGALEKIVYFECRLSQLDSELSAARDVASREKESAAGARARETAAAAELARTRSELDIARHRESELSERVRLLEGERERFLTGLIDQARIAGAPGDEAPAGEEADLAGFIAELRAEIDRLRPWKIAAEAAGLRLDEAAVPAIPPHAAVGEIARGFEAAGRLGMTRAEAIRMEHGMESRAERSLYESSMEDLASSDRHSRRRAADALRAMGSRAAAPLVAAAVGRERDEEVKVALLSALASLGEPAVAEVAARELSDARPAVRGAALDAVAALSGEAAEPRLLAALGDPSPLVRRRAVLLLGFARGPGRRGGAPRHPRRPGRRRGADRGAGPLRPPHRQRPGRAGPRPRPRRGVGAPRRLDGGGPLVRRVGGGRRPRRGPPARRPPHRREALRRGRHRAPRRGGRRPRRRPAPRRRPRRGAPAGGSGGCPPPSPRPRSWRAPPSPWSSSPRATSRPARRRCCSSSGRRCAGARRRRSPGSSRAARTGRSPRSSPAVRP